MITKKDASDIRKIENQKFHKSHSHSVPLRAQTTSYFKTLTINRPKYTAKPSLTCFDMHFGVINPVLKLGLDFNVFT